VPMFVNKKSCSLKLHVFVLTYFCSLVGLLFWSYS